MRPKDLNRGWVFWIKHESYEIRIPAKGTYSDIQRLSSDVVSQFKELDSRGGEYMKTLEAGAAKLGLDPRAYLIKVIHHQACLRISIEDRNRLCYSDGIGDDLHILAGKIDNLIDRAPKILSRLASVAVAGATKLATGRSSPTLSGCQTCGGTKSFEQNKNQLGRSGTLNSI